MKLESRQYPIGKYKAPETVSHEQRTHWMEELKAFPGEFRMLAQSLTQKQMDSSYREGGWTGLQVIHHVSDSHMNAYLRFRWAMSEDHPMIKAYNEAAWAAMEDYKTLDPEVSLSFIKAIHDKWFELQRHMSDEDWGKTYRHPEDGKTYQLDKVLGLYVWHGNHHMTHLKIIQTEQD